MGPFLKFAHYWQLECTTIQSAVPCGVCDPLPFSPNQKQKRLKLAASDHYGDDDNEKLPLLRRKRKVKLKTIAKYLVWYSLAETSMFYFSVHFMTIFSNSWLMQLVLCSSINLPLYIVFIFSNSRMNLLEVLKLPLAKSQIYST